MPDKKWARSASARLVLLCAPFATSWCYVLWPLDAPGWKENVLKLRAGMPLPRPSQEQWLASWSKVVQLRAQCHRNWLNSPQLAAETMRRFSGDVFKAFAFHVCGAQVEIRLVAQSLFPELLWHIEHACSHALGGDIVLKLLGSTVRGTNYAVLNGDLDLQVSRRPDSGRAHEPFTETDKRRVAQNLEKLYFITDVTVGNIAIKFTIQSLISVDLVLWRERPEEFPALRGGSSFRDNSKQINAFLDETPIAKQAITAIKSYFSTGRPKGLLLEAIAWRLGSMKMELKTMLRRVAEGSIPELLASFAFFGAMFEELRNWKRSPHFGRELQEDLGMLSDRKRSEYTAGFEEIARITDAGFEFQLLLSASDIRTLDAVLPLCHKAPAAAEEALRYYFSDFLEQENVLKMRRGVPAPKASQEQWLASWSKVKQLHAQCHRNWLNSPQLAAKTMRRFSGDIMEAFALHVSGAEEVIRSIAQSGFSHHLWQIEHACSHALGGDIVLEVLGSTVRGTGFSGLTRDLDLQVSRRPGSGRVHEPFTETDKRRVAQNLEKLPSLTDVTIGNIAIKFTLEPFVSVDLVLWRERPEEFPALRGGSSFHDNSKRINAFLDQTPVAKHAIIAIKTYCSRGRPKGLLLEAIAWRLGSMKMELKTILRRVAEGSIPERVASFTFFLAMFEELRNWKRSPHFGRELQQDLAMLSDRKRDEYTAGFEEIARITNAGFEFQLLLGASDVRTTRAMFTSDIWHKLPAAAEEALRHYFSDFL
ncbi:unnamed protein product [Symbiodinium necroappetens]|uniref:Uncharacterized protein n=1 Tax=Symbiodinium necroappetens TaxID=1628268 RepID=A0A812QFW4_9DINO|nr:unnamed protein product [Symbiodinium necroappetens]